LDFFSTGVFSSSFIFDDVLDEISVDLSSLSLAWILGFFPRFLGVFNYSESSNFVSFNLSSLAGGETDIPFFLAFSLALTFLQFRRFQFRFPFSIPFFSIIQFSLLPWLWSFLFSHLFLFLFILIIFNIILLMLLLLEVLMHSVSKHSIILYFHYMILSLLLIIRKHKINAWSTLSMFSLMMQIYFRKHLFKIFFSWF